MPRIRDLPTAPTLPSVESLVVSDIDGNARKLLRTTLNAAFEIAGSITAHASSPSIHPISGINGLQPALDAKLATSHQDGTGGAKHAVAVAGSGLTGGTPGFLSGPGQEVISALITPQTVESLEETDLVPIRRGDAFVWVPLSLLGGIVPGSSAAVDSGEFSVGPVSELIDGGEFSVETTSAVDPGEFNP